MLAQCLQVNYSLVQIPALMEKNGLPKSSLYFTPVQIQASCYLLLSYSPTPLSLLSVRGLSAKNHNNPYGVLSAVPTLFATVLQRFCSHYSPNCWCTRGRGKAEAGPLLWNIPQWDHTNRQECHCHSTATTVDKALIFNKQYSSYVIHHKLIINYIIRTFTSHPAKGL